jgi:hypothetical protein
MKRALFALAVVLVACGGGSKPAEEPGKSTSSTTTDGTSSSPASGGDPESCKKTFVGDCSKDDPGTAAYCGCAWDIAKTTYGDAMCQPSTEDLQKIHVKVAGSCSQHFPPEVIEKAFMAGCTKKQNDMQQYCTCSWTELAKKMPPGELVVERAKQSEKYQAAVRASANACQKLRPASR